MLRMMDHFDYQSARSLELAEEREKWFIAARAKQERKQVREERAEDELDDLATSAIQATVDQIEAFEAKLDAYDAATVEALMINQEVLDAVTEEINGLLLEAHTLPDGRKVFKTEDGSKVFAADGTEITDDVIPPEAISDARPTWETYKAKIDERDQLQRERKAIHDYQNKLDKARERSASGDLTQDELKHLDEDLADTMPPSLAKHLPDDLKPEIAKPVADIKADFSAKTLADPITKLTPMEKVVSPSVIPTPR